MQTAYIRDEQQRAAAKQLNKIHKVIDNEPEYEDLENKENSAQMVNKLAATEEIKRSLPFNIAHEYLAHDNSTTLVQGNTDNHVDNSNKALNHSPPKHEFKHPTNFFGIEFPLSESQKINNIHCVIDSEPAYQAVINDDESIAHKMETLEELEGGLKVYKELKSNWFGEIVANPKDVFLHKTYTLGASEPAPLSRYENPHYEGAMPAVASSLPQNELKQLQQIHSIVDNEPGFLKTVEYNEDNTAQVQMENKLAVTAEIKRLETEHDILTTHFESNIARVDRAYSNRPQLDPLTQSQKARKFIDKMTFFDQEYSDNIDSTHEVAEKSAMLEQLKTTSDAVKASKIHDLIERESEYRNHQLSPTQMKNKMAVCAELRSYESLLNTEIETSDDYQHAGGRYMGVRNSELIVDDAITQDILDENLALL